MKLHIDDRARQEIRDAVNYYRSKTPELGRSIAREIRLALRSIEEAPLRHALLEHVRISAEIRRVLLRRFPYIIVFEMLESSIEVLAVQHGSQRPGYWRNRRRGSSS